MNKHRRYIGLSNELPVAGKPLIIPFGRYWHKIGKVWQLVNSQTCAQMVAEFNAMATKPNFKGLPTFIGHPDVPSFQAKYTDHRSYAWIVDMIANESAQQLEIYPDWTQPGTELLSNEAFGYWSPNWLAFKGQRADEALPCKMLSIGLTQTPMIEYLALACEDAAENDEIIKPKENTMDKFLERLKALIGLDSVQTEDEVTGFVQKLIEGVRAIQEAQQARWKAEDAAYMALENEDPVAGLVAYIEIIATESASALALANEAVPEAATATISQLNEEMTLTNEGLVALQGQHAALMLDCAVRDGQVLPFARPKWDAKFAGAKTPTDYQTLANELQAIDPVLKTTSITKTRTPEGNMELTHGDLAAEAVSLANEQSISYSVAYRQTSKLEKFAHLLPTAQA